MKLNEDSALLGFVALALAVAFATCLFFTRYAEVQKQVYLHCLGESIAALQVCEDCAVAAARSPSKWRHADDAEISEWCLDEVAEPINPITGVAVSQ